MMKKLPIERICLCLPCGFSAAGVFLCFLGSAYTLVAQVPEVTGDPIVVSEEPVVVSEEPVVVIEPGVEMAGEDKKKVMLGMERQGDELLNYLISMD